MVAERALEFITGAVFSANVKGVRLQGEDTWRNYSKWATLPDGVPQRGDQVRLGVDASGFIRALEFITSTPTVQPEPIAPAGTVDREVAIRRMNVMTTATTLLSSHGPIDADEMLQLAQRLEAWILR